MSTAWGWKSKDYYMQSEAPKLSLKSLSPVSGVLMVMIMSVGACDLKGAVS